MSFFITSEGPGKGGDIGGLAGSDAHCEKLATAVGAGGKTWRGYLITNSTPAQAGIMPATASGAARGTTPRAS
jgi:hypothetical protein